MSKLREFFELNFLPRGIDSESPPVFADAKSSEPFFMVAQDADPEMERAHRVARATLPEFYAHCGRPGTHVCRADVRLPGVVRPKHLQKARHVPSWLSAIKYDSDLNQLSGEILRTPSVELEEIYPVGLTLTCKPEDTYDWLVIDDGRLYGGFTLRVARSRLSSQEQREVDSRMGVTTWVPSIAWL